MKKQIDIISFVVLLSLLMAGVAAAAPITITDNYWGADDHNYGDVIGSAADFDISKAVIDLSGSMLTVDIYTSFAGRADDHLFSSYTSNGMGIGYGDLFLASHWVPDGSQPYSKDNHANGTLWTYGFALDDRWSNPSAGSPGTGTLYRLDGATNDINAKLSGDFLSGNAIWRDGQEVAVDYTNANISSGDWYVDASNGFIRFAVDISGTTLLSGSEIAFHWGETCGNDVIEGKVAVPEPPTMILFGVALLGLSLVGKRRFIKA